MFSAFVGSAQAGRVLPFDPWSLSRTRARVANKTMGHRLHSILSVTGQESPNATESGMAQTLSANRSARDPP
jgi:hypothetical protein